MKKQVQYWLSVAGFPIMENFYILELKKNNNAKMFKQSFPIYKFTSLALMFGNYCACYEETQLSIKNVFDNHKVCFELFGRDLVY